MINDLLKKIKEAIYGEEVRNSIHDAIEQCYKDATGHPESVAATVKEIGEVSANLSKETADRKAEVNTERKRIDNLIASGTAQTQEIGKTIVQTGTSSSYMNMDYLAADKYYSGLFDGITFKDTDFFYIPSESGSGAEYVGKLLKPGLYHIKFCVKISKDGGLPEIPMRIMLKKGSTTTGEYSELKTEYIIFPQTSSSKNMQNVEYIFAITEPTYIKLFVTSIADGTGTFGFNASECTITAIDWKGKQSADLSELHDLRIGADSTVYDTAGEAVRKQIGNLTEDLSDLTDGVADVQYVTLPVTMSNEYVINPDGSVASSSSGHYVSNAVDISEYSVLKITACTNYTKLLYAFYDANSNFISGESSNAGESSTQITDKMVRVPNGAKYIRASQLYNVTPNVSITGEAISVKGIEILSDIVNDITTTETYQTDTIEAVTYESGYVNKSGISGSGDYVHTNKIPVNKGDRIYLVFAVSGNLGPFRFVTAYGTNDVAIYASGAENTTTAGYTVPDGVASVILSISGTNTSGALYNIHIERNTTQNVIATQSAKDLLFGKKWCVCGDSFSYGGQSVMPVFADGKYAGCRKVYPYFIGNRTHINIVDFTANGRTLAYPSDGSFSNSLTNPSADYYYQNIPTDVDYITIYLGINDSHHASGSSGSDGEDTTGVIPIGTIDDDTTATFGGAWNVVLSWLITNRPKAHIGIIVSNGVDNVNYRNLTIAIAKKYGIAYIDLNGDDHTPAMIRTVNPDIPQAVRTALINKWAVEVGVNTHPNTDAHEYESFFIENFLRNI